MTHPRLREIVASGARTGRASPLGRTDSPVPRTASPASLLLLTTSPASCSEEGGVQYATAAQIAQTTLLSQVQIGHLIQIANKLNVSIDVIGMAINEGQSYLQIAQNLCITYLLAKNFSADNVKRLLSNHFGDLNEGRALITQSNIQQAVDNLFVITQAKTEYQAFKPNQLLELNTLASLLNIDDNAKDLLIKNRSSFFTAAKALCRKFLINQGYADLWVNSMIQNSFDTYAQINGFPIKDQKTIPDENVQEAVKSLIISNNHNVTTGLINSMRD